MPTTPLRFARALLVVLAAGLCAATPVIDMPLKRVAEGVYFVQGQSALGSPENANFISNAAFVVADGGVLVIDALGSPALAQRLVEKIREVTPLPIRYVVVTHYHADHVYGLQVFRRLGAKIVAHAGAREYLNSDTARLRLEASRVELKPWVDESTRLIEPDIVFGADPAERDMRLAIGRTEFRLHHVGPSHTHEDLVVYLPERRVLFAGDLVFRGRIPFVGQADSRSWIGALERVLAWDAAVFVPGHGPTSTTPREDIALTRDYLNFLRASMGEAARQLEPFEEAYARTDWSRFSGLPLFNAANRINAYNTYLQMEQEAK